MLLDSMFSRTRKPLAQTNSLSLIVRKGLFAICKLPPEVKMPDWAYSEPFFSITRTWEELSIVCSQSQVPEGILAQTGFRALQVAGTLDFSLVGILASLTTALAQKNISLFALSTYDTDYLLVREEKLDLAVIALQEAGHRVSWD